MTEPVKGPASYFPSIEKKYGRPIGEWQELIRSSDLTKHMELVNWLKSEHGMGHGPDFAAGRRSANISASIDGPSIPNVGRVPNSHPSQSIHQSQPMAISCNRVPGLDSCSGVSIAKLARAFASI